MKKSAQNSFGMISFIALLIFAFSYILSRLGANMSFFTWIGSGLLLIVVLGNAWDYAHHQLSSFWIIAFYIIAIFAIASFVYGIV